MGSQTNDSNKNNSNMNTDNNGNPTGIMEFCKKHFYHITSAALFIILIFVLVKYTGNADGADGKKETETQETQTVLESTETVEEYQKDAYPEINELIGKYYKAFAKGNTDKLATLADPISDAEKSYIAEFSQYVEEYRNIACYTKKGISEDSFIVSAYMEIKFKEADTVAPGLETFYIEKKDGAYYINNLYGMFNSEMEEYDVDADIAALLSEFSQQPDVVKLQTEVQQKYEEAFAADENLKNIVETKLPDSITLWAYGQAEAAKKAEEEKLAAEEAAKKAAEEEAKKKEEEEKKAAELAAAVVVYATDKVNVRAEANETSEIIGKLEFGSQTTRLEEKDGWSRVDYNGGQQGYVKSEFLSLEVPQAPPENADADAQQEAPAKSLTEGSVITAKESVILRKSMGEDSEKIATVFAGEKITVIMSYAEGWTKVSYGEKTGFIKTALLQ